MYRDLQNTYLIAGTCYSIHLRWHTQLCVHIERLISMKRIQDPGRGVHIRLGIDLLHLGISSLGPHGMQAVRNEHAAAISRVPMFWISLSRALLNHCRHPGEDMWQGRLKNMWGLLRVRS